MACSEMLILFKVLFDQIYNFHNRNYHVCINHIQNVRVISCFLESAVDELCSVYTRFVIDCLFPKDLQHFSLYFWEECIMFYFGKLWKIFKISFISQVELSSSDTCNALFERTLRFYKYATAQMFRSIKKISCVVRVA